MKLDGKQVRFRIVGPWFGRRRLLFAGRQNTLQLLETALVVEGHLQRFFYFLVDRFMRSPFSEWSTVTVPYSRILSFRYAPMIIPRVIAYLCLWLPIVFLALVMLGKVGLDHMVSEGQIYLLAMLAVAAAGVTLACHFRLLAARNYLMFRQADGTPALVCFRIPSKNRRLAFEAQLREYRLATRDRGVSLAALTEAERNAPSPAVWVVLLVFLLARQGIPFFYQWDRLRPWPQAHLLALAALLAALLPPALMSLYLVTKRSEVVRWMAVFAVALCGLVPVYRLIFSGPTGAQPGDAEASQIIEAGASVLFHFALAVTLTVVTGAAPKEDGL